MGKAQVRERDDSYPGTFTDKWVKATRGYEHEVQYAERLKKGLSLMLHVSPPPQQSKTWRVIFYDAGRPRSKKIGTYPAMTVAQARKDAGVFDAGREIASANAGTFQQVSDEWIADHVVKKGLRSKSEIERQLRTYVLPAWGKTPIFDIKRRDVNQLLRVIEKKHTAPQADAVLSTIRSIMTWYAVEDGDYTPAVVPKMGRDKREAKEKERDRILSRAEIRAVWEACNDLPVYGDMVRLLLLTGQRLRKVSQMRRSDIVTRVFELQRDGKTAVVTFNNVWNVHTEKREKGNIGEVALPDLAVEIIKRQQVVAKNPYVFPASSGTGPFATFSRSKKELDAEIRNLLPDMEPWVLHDLRRTARSLLSEMGVQREIRERVIGHTITGVEGVYDRYDYFEEKTNTLRRLETHIKAILNPPDLSNVENLAAHASKRVAGPAV